MAPQAWPSSSPLSTPQPAITASKPSERSLPDRTIAIIAVLSVVFLASLIACAIYFYRRHRRSSTKLRPQIKVLVRTAEELEHRKQTHADPKVHAWLSRLTSDFTGAEGFRLSISRSVRTVDRPFSMLSDKWNWRDSVMSASDMEERKGDDNETEILKKIRFEP